MTFDPHGDPIGRHLEARARDIHLPRTDVGAIASRAAARTSRRRKVTFGVTAVALLAAGTVAVAINGGGDDGRTPVATSPEAVVASPLEWTVVDPTVGLGPAAMRTSVVGGDGAIYDLSTEPGPNGPDIGPEDYANRTLYRSADGADWEQLTLPDQLFATALAVGGNRLYAVGTGPSAGDEVPVRLSASDDNGATWSDPIDLPTLPVEAAYPDEIVTGSPAVAVHGDTTVVARSIQANIDLNDRLPAALQGKSSAMNADGVTVYDDPVDCGPDGACPPPPVLATLTWEQLGVEPDLAALVDPQVHVFASVGDAPFVEVPVPVDGAASSPHLVATDSGFTLATAGFQQWDPAVGEVPGSTSVFTSVDGRAWKKATVLPDLSMEAVGVVRDRVMVAGWSSTNQSHVEILGPEGVVGSVVPSDAIDGTGWSTNFFGAGGFGALGWAVVAYSDDDSSVTQVVHSDPTGLVTSAVPVPAELDAWGYPIGVMVTPDAIIVRFVRMDGDPSTADPERLFVGTPRG